MKSGELALKCHRAELTHDTEFLGKMSPYLEVTCGEQKLQTACRRKAGKKPDWNSEILLFQLVGAREMTLKVLDYEPTGNHDLVGEAVINCADLPNGTLDDQITIDFKGKSAGTVFLTFEFTPQSKTMASMGQAMHNMVP